MSSQKLFILAVIAAGTVFWAVRQSHLSEGSGSSTIPTYLIQGLDPATVAAVDISAADANDTVRLKRDEGQFLVTNKSNYPADNKQINDLLTKCLDIKTLQLASDNPANHADLEVTEDKAQHVIKFFDSDGALITGLIVGKNRDGGQGQYARLVDKNEVYLVENVPWFKTNATDYLNQEIVAIKADEIQSLAMASPKGIYELVAREPDEGGGKYTFLNLPKGKRLKTSDADRVFGALSSVRFDDVFKEAPDGLAMDSSITCKLKSGVVYTFKMGTLKDKYYLTGQAEYTGDKSIQLDTSKADSQEELKKKEAVLLANKTALEFTEGHKGWVYQIPKWKADALLKSPDDLLEAIPAPKPVSADVMNQVMDANAAPTLGPTLPDPNR